MRIIPGDLVVCKTEGATVYAARRLIEYDNIMSGVNVLQHLEKGELALVLFGDYYLGCDLVVMTRSKIGWCSSFSFFRANKR